MIEKNVIEKHISGYKKRVLFIIFYFISFIFVAASFCKGSICVINIFLIFFLPDEDSDYDLSDQKRRMDYLSSLQCEQVKIFIQ